MITFSKLKDLVDENHISKIQLKRKPEIMFQYQNYIKTIDYSSFENFIFENKTDYIIRQNDFPYDLEPNIKHYILWLKDESLDVEIILLENNFIFNDNLIWYRNSPENRSIKNIVHYHIFTLT